jgi:hypothetical protein
MLEKALENQINELEGDKALYDKRFVERNLP